MSNITKKRCSKCGEYLPLSRFTKNALRKDGYDTMCRQCKARYQSERYRSRMLGVPTKPAPPRVDSNRVLDLMSQGLGAREIATVLRCDRTTVYKIARAYHVTFDSTGGRTNGERENTLKPVSGREKCTCRCDCVNYPCFVGIDTLDSNLAHRCRNFKQKSKAS